MASLQNAPKDQLIKARNAKDKLKKLLATNKVHYGRVYSSFSVREGKVRIKLWYISGLANSKPQFTAKVNKLGFNMHYPRGAKHFGTGCTSIVGLF